MSRHTEAADPVEHPGRTEAAEYRRVQNVLASYVDDPEPKDVLSDLLERVRRQEIAWGIYARAIHECASEPERQAKRDVWGQRRQATEDALREALGMEERTT